MTEQEWREKFARAVRVRMRRKNMTQTELAELAGIDRRTLNKYMLRQRIPPANVITKIATVLECSTDELLIFSEDDY